MTPPPIASIIIPIAPSHASIANRAISSAHAQTLPCEVLPVVDDELRGAGWARNQGIAQATTDYLIFLDADDWMMPTFVERCLQVHLQTGRYVYTDWQDQHGKRYTAPECAWVNTAWHAVTAFIPTAWARSIGGFDEALALGGEDSEFFVHLCTEGHCGTRLPETLFVYSDAPDSRSKRWHDSPQRQAYNAMIQERYVDKGKTAMGCCTEPAKKLTNPDAPAPQMVLARPKWGGNRRERGLITGTVYPPADKSQIIEVDPRDAAARPDHWDVVVVPPPQPQVTAIEPQLPTPAQGLTPPSPSLEQLARRALQLKPPPPAPPVPPPPAAVVPTAPDFDRLMRVAQSVTTQSINGEWRTTNDGLVDMFYPAVEAPPAEPALKTLNPALVTVLDRVSAPSVHRTGDPVFVFPDKDYPSYTDVRRLVELSGFSITHPYMFPSDQTYIWLSPEPPPDYMQFEKNHIWWSLEYGGDYEPDLSGWRGEVWASDPAWAKAHDAKLVIMGSHERLADAAPSLVTSALKYDVVMLAYMTRRRQMLAQQLADLSMPTEIYPGYGIARDEQLTNTRLMLHVHQHDDTHAIAPQRIALAAAYKLPLICENVPEPGEYERYLPFIRYEHLNSEVRSQLAMWSEGTPQARGQRLHDWLCKEWTFRRCVEEALK